jgi:cell division protease FtsH
MPQASTPPPRRRQNQIFSALLLIFLLLSSIYYITAPDRGEDEKLTNAPIVPISEITQRYAKHSITEIMVRGSNVYAKTLSGTYIQSYKEGSDSVSTLGWNDPKNPTVVKVDNVELKNFFMQHLGDLIFFLLMIGLGIWVFRSIARSQGNAMSFGKSRARIADARQVKTSFKDVAGCDEAKNDLKEIVFLEHSKLFFLHQHRPP